MINLEFYKEEIKEKCKYKKRYSDSTLYREDVANALYEIWKDNAPIATDMLDWFCEEHEEPILDNVEKAYLKNVIKPFRENVANIVKWGCNDDLQYLTINLSNGIIRFPTFTKDTMYKNMEPNRSYTLEELDL